MEQNENLAVEKFGEFDATIRTRALEAIAAGMTKAEMARGAGINSAIVTQYLSPDGNKYSGAIEKYERRIAAFLDRRNLESLAGISTIDTPVSLQIARAAKMVRRCHIMGKGIGPSGIGKTRGCALLQKADETTLVLAVSREEGTREFIRSELFRLMGIRGPKKIRANRRRVMYSQLVQRLRGTEILLVIDQAHMLSTPAIDFLVELWNATHAPQLWLGTEKLEEKVQRDEQWASRLEFSFPIGVTVDKECNEVVELVQHQIRQRLPELNGEMKPLTRLCERLAVSGNFRRVEMRLATMLHLKDSPTLKNLSWCELFERSAEYLRSENGD